MTMIRSTYKGWEFGATLGLTPGYGHANESEVTVADVAAAWTDENRDRQFLSGAPWIPVVMSEAAAVYAPEHGCPAGGERIVVIRGSMNPHWYGDLTQWRRTAEELLRVVAERFDQSTTQVSFWDSEFVYFQKDR